MAFLRSRTAAVLLLGLIASATRGLDWPLPPGDSVHPLGHTWGNYISFGVGNFHTGVDVMTPNRANPPVLAVADGWVKAWGTNGGNEFWDLAVSDSGPGFSGRAPGWLYTHVDPGLPHAGLGEEIREGDTIGHVVRWPVTGFDHLHFARISDTGATWQRFPGPTWWYIGNPLPTLAPPADTVAPLIEDALVGQRFAFCADESNDYLEPDSLCGDVDIITKVADLTGYSGNPAWDRVGIFELAYCILDSAGAAVVPWTTSVRFSNRLERSLVGVVYKQVAPCRSRGDYQYRDYYYIATNTDGDTVIESDDRYGCWATGSYPDGHYVVRVRAADAQGNTTTDSMAVTVANAGGMAEAKQGPTPRNFAVEPSPATGPVRFRLPSGARSRFRLLVFDPAGRLIETLAGTVDARNAGLESRRLPAGVYLAELVLDGRPAGRRRFAVVR